MFPTVKKAIEEGYIPVDWLFDRVSGYEAMLLVHKEGANELEMASSNGAEVTFLLSWSDALAINEKLLSHPGCSSQDILNRQELSSYLREKQVEPILQLRNQLERIRVTI